MKKIYIILCVSALIITGCTGGDKAAENAIKYAKESVFSNMSGVKSIKVTAMDSVLTDEMVEEQPFIELNRAVMNGTVAEEVILRVSDSLQSIGLDIYRTWKGGSEKDEIRSKYAGYWHKLYTVTATMKSGAKKDVRVMMEQDGVTPAMNEDEFKQKQKNRKGVKSIILGTQDWDY